MDPVQLLLIVVILTLTVLLSVISIEVYKLVKELRETIKAVNKIVDGVEKMSGKVMSSACDGTSFLKGVKNGIALFNLLSDFFKNKRDKNE